MATRKFSSVQESMEYILVIEAIADIRRELYDVYEGFSDHIRYITNSPQTQYALGIITGFDSEAYGDLPYGQEDLEAISEKIDMLVKAQDTIANPTSESATVQESVNSLDANLQQAIYRLVAKKMGVLYRDVENHIANTNANVENLHERINDLHEYHHGYGDGEMKAED